MPTQGAERIWMDATLSIHRVADPASYGPDPDLKKKEPHSEPIMKKRIQISNKKMDQDPTQDRV